MRVNLFKIGVYLFLLVAGLSSSLHAANSNYEINIKNIQTHVAYLTSDVLEGRLTGSVGEKLAAEYIAVLFHNLGLEPAGDNGTYFQDFNFTYDSLPLLSKGKITGHTEKRQQLHRGRNVLAKLSLGNSPQPLIIVGAHLDHLGRGKISGSRSRDKEKDMIHPGADDNASGVASVLEIAAKLSYLKAQGNLHGNKDILFAAWSGEEIGILGSSHYINSLVNKSLRSTIDAALNLDMVGHLKENLIIQGFGSSADWPNIINQVKNEHSIKLTSQNDPYLPTDSTSFYIHGVPTLNFFTGAHDEYHTPRDTKDILNYEGIKNISELLVNLIIAIENKKNPINFKEVQQSHNKPNRQLKLYLGTIPDYASSDILGVKISGVAKSSPAQLAGLKLNDVIVELAGKSIQNIYDYTSVLNSLHVGKAVKLVVLRQDRKVTLSITARYRE